MVTSILEALKMAVINIKYNNNLMCHSGWGLQYCSKEYAEYLSRNNILTSVTQSYNRYENAIVERVNGI